MAFQDFDLIQERRRNERRQKIKKRITIAAVSTIVILLVVAGAVCLVVFNQNEDNSSPTPAKKAAPAPSKPAPKATPTPLQSDKAIEVICSYTDYKQTCESSLNAAKANLSASQPYDFLKASMTSAADEVDKAIKAASAIKIDDPKKKAAFDNCLVLLNDAKEELNSSVSTIDGKNVGKVSSISPELYNWLSAVMSYQQTCIDGIPEGKEKSEVEKSLKPVRELTSNSLAMISKVTAAPVLGSDIKRRLLGKEVSMPSLDENEFPTWINQESRRMLKVDAPTLAPNVTVAKDGSGNFTTISAALAAIPQERKGRYVIYVKEGIYDENVVVTKKMVNVTMYGDGSQKSMITGNKNFVDGVPTFQTATFAALGEGFMAQSIGFRNTAGPEKHQAVALRVQADRSIFLNCRMEGYQDTLYAQTHRQFYRSCYITGTVDFIFGDAAAVFQNCMIYVRRPMENQKNIVTAQGRLDKHETTGIVLQNCRILADDKLEPEKAKIKSYLGRPWKEHSRTIVMETEIGDLIDPEGWLPWSGDFALKTLYYAEYNNKGPGAQVTARVKWPGYKLITRAEALNYTAGPFIQAESWLKDANVPVRFGLFS